MQYLLTFRSLTYAQQGSKVLERAGISSAVIRVPKELSARGCSYGLSLQERHIYSAEKVLSKSGFLPEKVYLKKDDGSLEEIYDLF